MPLTTYYFPQPISDPTQLTLHALQTKYPFEQWQLEREMHLMGLDIELLWRPYFNLSGGEQTKVQLALLFATDQGFALIDEPTNHLDVASRYQVATYLTRK